MQKLKGGGKILAASRHNKRQIQAEQGANGHIDAARICLNTSLHGPSKPEEVAGLARSLMAAAGVRPQKKNAVLGIEQIFSLPPNTAIDPDAYFRDCLQWVAQNFGGIGNVLSADIHLDESAPHMHVLILPLIDGRMNGSDMFGNRQRLQFLHTDFHAAVAGRYGLAKAPARLQGQARGKTAQTVIKRIQAMNDGALKSAIWPVVRDLIDRDPVAFAQALGLEITRTPEKKLRTMAQIFTSKGKGSDRPSKPIGFADRPKPIGLETPARSRTLCSVGFAPEPAPPTRHGLPVLQGTDDNRIVNRTLTVTQCRKVPQVTDEDRVVDRSDCDFVDWQETGEFECGE